MTLQNYSKLIFASILGSFLIANTADASQLCVEKVIEFNERGNGLAYLGAGWHGMEGTHVWSSSQFASINLDAMKDLIAKSSSIKFEVTAANTYPAREAKNIGITFQNQMYGMGELSPQKSMSLHLPIDHTQPNATTLQFGIPNWDQSPQARSEGADARCLGIALKNIRVTFNLALNQPQDLPWTTDAGTVVFTLFPTIGDGDCLFHATSTEPREEHAVVTLKAAGMRTNLCDSIQRGERVNELKPIIYEHYIDLLARNDNDQRVPEQFRRIVQLKNEYTTMINSMQKFGVVSTAPLERPETKYPTDLITNMITSDEIKQYMERYRVVGGPDTYIPIRPDMTDPADIIAQQSGKRFNVFSFNDRTKSLDLVKQVGRNGPLVNVLINGAHFSRLLHPSHSPVELEQCHQIYLNYLAVAHGH
jgi:hypothetical protein